ncbi:MAG: hypothetical protein ABW079_03570 [Sedimenticola sp.]
MKSPSVDNVFFVTSRGYAADHWYSWFVKALNCHNEILAYLANEGSRPKYFAERSREERPDVITYARFLSDVGMTYQGIGDCYSYRANKMEPIIREFGDDIRIININRHPFVWLKFYVTWRTNNMRMLNGENGPIDHEWNISNHELFESLGLKSYARSDIERWATYQGMFHLNKISEDIYSDIKQYLMEDIVSDRAIFNEVVSYLTHDRCKFSDNQLDDIYAMAWVPFKGEDKLRIVPGEEYCSWESWKIDAYEKIVTSETRSAFQSLGYEL